MSTTKLIISPAYLKERRRELEENIKDAPIESAIRQAQDLDIVPIIGSGLFNQIISQLPSTQGGSDTLSAANENLLDNYLNPALAEYAYARMLPALHYKVTTKGIQTRNTETSDPVDAGVLNKLIDSARQVAEQYGQRLVNFLQANLTTYPLYGNPGTGVDVINPNGNQMRSGGGIHFGSDRGNFPFTENHKYGS